MKISIFTSLCAIYANNKNRNFVTKYGIKTGFKPKGRRSKHRKHQDQLARMITKERTSPIGLIIKKA